VKALVFYNISDAFCPAGKGKQATRKVFYSHYALFQKDLTFQNLTEASL